MQPASRPKRLLAEIHPLTLKSLHWPRHKPILRQRKSSMHKELAQSKGAKVETNKWNSSPPVFSGLENEHGKQLWKMDYPKGARVLFDAMLPIAPQACKDKKLLAMPRPMHFSKACLSERSGLWISRHLKLKWWLVLGPLRSSTHSARMVAESWRPDTSSSSFRLPGQSLSHWGCCNTNNLNFCPQHSLDVSKLQVAN